MRSLLSSANIFIIISITDIITCLLSNSMLDLYCFKLRGEIINMNNENFESEETNIELEELDKDLNDFKEIYRLRINEFTKKINRQFSLIVPGNIANCKTNIEIKNKGTSVSIQQDYNFEDFSPETCFNLIIGFNEIKLMCETHNIDIFDSFCKLVSHEYMHVLLNHLDSYFQRETILFAKGELKNDYDYKKNSYYIPSNKGIKRNIKDVTDEEVSKFSRLLNYACDFQINVLLNIREPFMNPKDFDLPEDLEAKEYLSILYHLLEDEYNNDFKESDSGNFISEYFGRCRNNIKEKLDKDLKEFDSYFNDIENSISSSQFGNKYSRGNIVKDGIFSNKRKEIKENYIKQLRIDKVISQGNISNYITKLNSSEFVIWKCFKNILRDIKKSESEYKLSLVDKKDDWCKFNNRKDSTLLYPGKIYVSGNIERKIDHSSVMFVDISGSMSMYIEPLFTLCYILLKSLNIKIVFYDTNIITIYDNRNDKIKIDRFIGGGTNFGNSYKEYIEKYKFKKPNKIYILTDGYDYTLPDPSSKNNSIWVFKSGKEKNEIIKATERNDLYNEYI